jgi:hypothetical protein
MKFETITNENLRAGQGAAPNCLPGRLSTGYSIASAVCRTAALAAVMALPAAAAFPNGYSYCKLVTTSASMVSGTVDLSNFPLTVYLTDSDMKTVANGGLVNNASGYDIGFYPDCSGSGTPLKWEMESYSPTTGALVAHVLRPVLSHTVNDTIGMYYGAAFSTLQSTPVDVWDSNYAAVWHMALNGATLADSTANANGGTVVGTVSSATGKLDGAVSNSTYGINAIRVNDAASLRVAAGKLTISAWMYQSSRNANGAIVVQKRIATTDNPLEYGFFLDPSGVPAFQFYNSGYHNFYDASSIPLNTWTYVTITVDEAAATKLRFYRDGVQNSAPAYSSNILSGTNPLQLTNFDRFNGGVFPINGIVDELRISNVARTADWIRTEYRNQNAPGTYLSLGPRATSGVTATKVRHSVSGGE